MLYVILSITAFDFNPLFPNYLVNRSFTFFFFVALTSTSDIVYAIDTSNNIDDNDLTQMAQFIRNDIKHHDSKSKVALVNYGSQAEVVASLDTDQQKLVDVLSKLQKLGGARGIDNVLALVKDNIFSNTAESTNTKQLILFVGGRYSQPVKERLLSLLTTLKERSVKITVIGFGENIRKDDFIYVASQDKNVILVNHVTDLPKVVPDVFEIVGRNTGKILYLTNFHSSSLTWIRYEIQAINRK